MLLEVSVDGAHSGTAFLPTMKLDEGIGSQPVWPIQGDTARRKNVYALTGHQRGTLYNGTGGGGWYEMDLRAGGEISSAARGGWTANIFTGHDVEIRHASCTPFK